MMIPFSSLFSENRRSILSLAVNPLLLCVSVMTLLSLSVLPAQADELQTIRAAWDKHHDAIKSFHYECDLEETSTAMVAVMEEVGGIEEPQDKDIEKEPIILLSDLSYSMANGKLAMSMFEQSSDERTKGSFPKHVRRCFNGVDLTTLMKGRIGYIATVDFGVELTNSNIVRHAKVTPIWLWYSPSTLVNNRGFQLDKAEITGRNIRVRLPNEHSDGADCIELLMPRKAGLSAGLLYVDPSRDYLPVRLVERDKNDTITSEITLEYAPHDRVGWAISKWQNDFISQSGDSDTLCSCQVQSVTINEPLDEKLFTLEFPVGTRIIVRKGGTWKWYIQEPDGERRQIDKDEFGKPPKRG